MISSFFLGLLTGFSLSIPIGPINLTVINEAFRKGFARAVLIGLGGVTADTFYCAMAFLGFSPFLSKVKFLWPSLQFVGGVIVFVIGIRYLVCGTVDFILMDRTESSIRHHITKAFPIGFFMGISNFSLFILWGGVNTLFISHGWLEPDLRIILITIAGICAGSSAWFVLISFLVGRLHRQISPEMIAQVARVCGFLLVVFGLILCYRAVFRPHSHFF